MLRLAEDAGLNHIVFDLRFRYADWYQQIDFLGQEVVWYAGEPVWAGSARPARNRPSTRP